MQQTPSPLEKIIISNGDVLSVLRDEKIEMSTREIALQIARKKGWEFSTKIVQQVRLRLNNLLRMRSTPSPVSHRKQKAMWKIRGKRESL